MRLYVFGGVCLLLCCVCVGVQTASAAEIKLARSRSGEPLRGITIEGEIAAGDFAVFRALALSTKGVSSVWLASPGGDFIEALRIGRLIRALSLEVWAPLYPRLQLVQLTDPANNTCASSCFFLYIAGVRRFGSVLAIHRPHVPADANRAMSLEEASAAHRFIRDLTEDYLREMGAPPAYLSRIMAAGSRDLVWLSKDEVEQDFEGLIEEYQEWFSSSCTLLTREQAREDERLRRKHLRNEELSFAELAFRAEVDRIIKVGGECVSARLREVQEERRLYWIQESLGRGRATPKQ